jgi:hypothetical protein
MSMLLAEKRTGGKRERGLSNVQLYLGHVTPARFAKYIRTRATFSLSELIPQAVCYLKRPLTLVMTFFVPKPYQSWFLSLHKIIPS